MKNVCGVHHHFWPVNEGMFEHAEEAASFVRTERAPKSKKDLLQHCINDGKC